MDGSLFVIVSSQTWLCKYAHTSVRQKKVVVTPFEYWIELHASTKFTIVYSLLYYREQKTLLKKCTHIILHKRRHCSVFEMFYVTKLCCHCLSICFRCQFCKTVSYIQGTAAIWTPVRQENLSTTTFRNTKIWLSCKNLCQGSSVFSLWKGKIYSFITERRPFVVTGFVKLVTGAFE